jgi:hypothetical protein
MVVGDLVRLPHRGRPMKEEEEEEHEHDEK